MSTLDDLVKWCKVVDTTGRYPPLPTIYPHHTVYAQSLIEHNLGIKLSLEEVHALLIEEGLIPKES